ncbi:exodeoxyribonuclease V subunit gamma, partial [Nocardia cyriacigeorgica]|uniref:exodeoxyribonuclease V subunit gamma n=1 Tax=Nocardia cyriacigeorgica TaxID=135487 RepID=UPI002456847A
MSSTRESRWVRVGASGTAISHGTTRTAQPAPACDVLRAEPAIVRLPQRVSLFGPTRLPADQPAVIEALAARRDVHLW